MGKNPGGWRFCVESGVVDGDEGRANLGLGESLSLGLLLREMFSWEKSLGEDTFGLRWGEKHLGWVGVAKQEVP